MIRAVLLASTLILAPAGDGAHRLDVETVDGEQRVTLHARNLPGDEVLEELCSALGRDLRWTEEIERIPNVTVHMDDRYAPDVLRCVAGAAGLRVRTTTDAVEVGKDLGPFAEAGELRFAAEAAYTMALRRFPGHPRRIAAREALARMAVEEGRPDRAIEHYGYLIEEFRSARAGGDAVTPELLEFLPEALVRTGRLQVQVRRWQSARETYQLLSDVSKIAPHEHFPEALRELARCDCELGDPKRALYQVRALSSNPEFAPKDELDRSRRLLIEARALILTKDPVAALRLLDECARLGQVSFQDFEVMELRARALEANDRPGDAAHAWLGFYADVEDPQEQRRALKRAAELALSAGDEIAVMMIHELAASRGWGGDLGAALNLARARLGIESTNFLAGSTAERLLRGEDLHAAGMDAEAREVLGSLYDVHGVLDPRERTRLALVYARVLDRIAGIDQAVEVLRTIAATLDSDERRARLYLLAAELYEAREMFDEAVLAYGGTL